MRVNCKEKEKVIKAFEGKEEAKLRKINREETEERKIKKPTWRKG
jgi:hypothetical protein